MRYIYQNGIDIPAALHETITELICTGTDITEIPNTLINITLLYFSFTKVAKIPVNLIKLKHLECTWTDITEIPNTLVNLTRLRCAGTNIPCYITNYNDSGWGVLRFGSMLMIGCKVYNIAKWAQFSDYEINLMDDKALKFWKKNKSKLLEGTNEHKM